MTPDLQVRKWSLREGKALTRVDHFPWVSQDGSVQASPASCSRSPGVTLPGSFPVDTSATAQIADRRESGVAVTLVALEVFISNAKYINIQTFH